MHRYVAEVTRWLALGALDCEERTDGLIAGQKYSVKGSHGCEDQIPGLGEREMRWRIDLKEDPSSSDSSAVRYSEQEALVRLHQGYHRNTRGACSAALAVFAIAYHIRVWLDTFRDFRSISVR